MTDSAPCNSCPWQDLPDASVLNMTAAHPVNPLILKILILTAAHNDTKRGQKLVQNWSLSGINDTENRAPDPAAKAE